MGATVEDGVWSAATVPKARGPPIGRGGKRDQPPKTNHMVIATPTSPPAPPHSARTICTACGACDRSKPVRTVRNRLP